MIEHNLDQPEKIVDHIRKLQRESHKFNQLKKVKDFHIEEIDNLSQFLDHGLETANQFRTAGEAKRIWKKMLADDNNVIYFGLSGDMATAGMAPTISYLINNHYIDVLFSQGANLYHDLAATLGFDRYQTSPQQKPDTDLFDQGMVRMYDVLEEASVQRVSPAIVKLVADEMESEGHQTVSTRQFYYYLGKKLTEWDLIQNEGILTSCFLKNIPIFVAGPESSVIGMDLAAAQNRTGNKLEIGIGKELQDHSIMQDKIENLGFRSNLIEIGGGVMRNTIQQVATGSYIVRGHPFDKNEPEWFKRHLNAILITTDTGVPFGGASAVPMVEHNPNTKYPQGENLSWGKFDPEGQRVTVYLDATIALPLLVLGLRDDPEIQDIIKTRKPISFSNLDQFPINVQKSAK